MTYLWPSLETERTRLRRITDQDLDFIFNHFRNPDVCLYLVDAEPPDSPEAAQEIINWCNGNGNPNLRQNRWLIVFKETGQSIGTVGFHNLDRTNHTAEIKHDLRPDRTGVEHRRRSAAASTAFRLLRDADQPSPEPLFTCRTPARIEC